MDLDPRSHVPSLTYFCQGKSVEELRQILIYANVELQNVRLQAQEEIRKRDEELRLFRNVLSQAVRERDEAHAKLHKVLVENLSHQTHQAPEQQEEQQKVKQALAAPVSGVTSIEDELKRGGFSSSEGDESIVSSPVVDPSQAQLSISFHEEVMELLVQEKRALPEKGKLLDAVMTAGPLLQTLLLAGPLPQWRHPPPPLEPSQIPPVAIPSPSPPPPPQTLLHRGALRSIADYSCINECGRLVRKRSSMEGPASSTKIKYQRILLN